MCPQVSLALWGQRGARVSSFVLRLTVGGTVKPKLLPTFWRSSSFTSNTFFSECEAYD